MNFFFVKQKTAYEIPKRDWSSDVCSSDLRATRVHSKTPCYSCPSFPNCVSCHRGVSMSFENHSARRIVMFGALLCAVAPSSSAQQPARPDLAKLFDKREVMIPVRDGVKLHTEIYTPKDAKEPLPMLLDRTPYGISAPDRGMSGQLFRYSEMFADGYIFVFQDIRGRYGSEGKFEMLHTAPDAKGVNERTDAYDTRSE